MYHPTREQYESNPRGKDLRETCLALLDALEQENMGEVKQHEQRLHEMDITAGMQASLPSESYLQNSVIYAEWVAGQVLSLLEKVQSLSIISRKQAVLTLEEFGEKVVDTTYILKDPSASFKHFVAIQKSIEIFRHLLASSG